MVKVTVSPTLGVASLTDLVTARSAVAVTKAPTLKSESVELRELEERVSAMKLERSYGRPRAVTSMPPSKNSPGRKVLSGVPLLSANCQPPEGVLTVFTVAQALLGSTARSWREPSEPPDPTHL